MAGSPSERAPRGGSIAGAEGPLTPRKPAPTQGLPDINGGAVQSVGIAKPTRLDGRSDAAMTKTDPQPDEAPGAIKSIGEIGKTNGPIELHSVTVAPDGALKRQAPRLPMDFRFTWRDIDFQGDIDEWGQGVRLRLQTDLGPLPYTAQDADARQNLIALITSAQSGEPCKLEIIEGQTVVLTNEIDLPGVQEFSVRGIVTHIAVLLLAVAPYLDFIAAHGLNAQKTA